MKTFRKTFVKSFIKKKLLVKASAKKPLRKASSKAQSAMEYLMTYGWAILIIAVVLGALFQLGVFNANNFAPKAPPGSCQVFRPNGPGTTSFINLEGVCSGEMPEYVFYSGNYNIMCNSAGGPYILVGSYNAVPSDLTPNQFTISFWAKPIAGPGVGCDAGVVNKNWNENKNSTWLVTLLQSSSSVYWGGFVINTSTTNSQIWVTQPVNPGLNLGTWYFVAFEYNGSYIALFVNGGNVGIRYVGPIVNYPQTPIGIGTRHFITANRIVVNSWRNFNGYIANVQLYNTSLSANEIQALYLEGIGGAPIDLQNLVGWWPLNGNANDYSGNSNNGVPTTNATFSSNWWSGYTPP